MATNDDTRSADLWDYAEVLTGFHRAWQQGDPPSIADFLPAADQVSDETLRQLLTELVVVDLEHRWRRWAEETTHDGSQTAADQASGLSERSRPLLEDYLKEWPQLGTAESLPPSAIVQEYRIRRCCGDDPGHEEYVRRFPTQAVTLHDCLSTIDEEQPRESSDTTDAHRDQATVLLAGAEERHPDDTSADTIIEGTQTIDLSEAPSRPSSAGGAPSLGRFGNYDLLDELAGGAMGIVYKARQRGIDRVVALKMIRTSELPSEEEIRRFHDEARHAGRLEHPNIVRIYESGEHEGRHYIAMAFVDGQSLAEIVRENTLDNRTAARYIKKTADAIQFAHSREVLHRDLKPANVLIDELDEPQVTDFGLAKRVGDDSEATREGSVLGTPSYMPPEQAEGRVQDINTASDVYSLGAVFYHLLTGRPPFVAQNVLGTLLQVVEDDPIPLRMLNREIDPDLEAVCLKCLEKDPARRVKSAAELSHLLDLFLNNKPLPIRRISTFGRFLKWCRRNPVVAGLSIVVAVLLVAISAGATYGYFEQRHLSSLAVDEARKAKWAEREAIASAVEEKKAKEDAEIQRDNATEAEKKARDAEAVAKRAQAEAETQRDNATAAEKKEKAARTEAVIAKGEAEKERDNARKAENTAREAEKTATDARRQAEKSLETALHAVDQLLNRVADEDLAAVPQMEMLRQKLGNDAKVFVDRILEHCPGDDRGVFLRGRIHRTLGNINQVLHNDADAKMALRNARDDFRARRADAGMFEQISLELVLSNRSLGDVLTDSQEFDEALLAYDEAIEIGTELVTRFPESAEYVFELARTYTSLGVYHDRHGAADDAETTYRKSLEHHETARDLDSTSDPKHAQKLALVHNNLATVYGKKARFDDAISELGEAISIQETLVADHPEVPAYRKEYAQSRLNRGGALEGRRDWKSAETDIQAAIDVFDKLAGEFPATPAYRYQLAVSHREMARLDMIRDDRDAQADSVAHFQKAIQSLEPLNADFQEDIEFGRELATTRLDFGLLLANRAAKIVADPGAADTDDTIANARSELIQALAAWERLEAVVPDPVNRLNMARCHQCLAALAGFEKNGAEQQKALDKAIAVLEPLCSEFPGVSEYQEMLDTCRKARERGR